MCQYVFFEKVVLYHWVPNRAQSLTFAPHNPVGIYHFKTPQVLICSFTIKVVFMGVIARNAIWNWLWWWDIPKNNIREKGAEKYKLQLDFLDYDIITADTMSEIWSWTETVHDDTLTISIIVEHMESHYDLDNLFMDV